MVIHSQFELCLQVKRVSEFHTDGQLLVRGAAGVSLGGRQFDIAANGDVVVSSQVIFYYVMCHLDYIYTVQWPFDPKITDALGHSSLAI